MYVPGRRKFRAGDEVKHDPSGEVWSLACDEVDGWVYPKEARSYEPGRAKDCTMVDPASDAGRLKALRETMCTPRGSAPRGHAKRQLMRAQVKGRFGPIRTGGAVNQPCYIAPPQVITAVKPPLQPITLSAGTVERCLKQLLDEGDVVSAAQILPLATAQQLAQLHDGTAHLEGDSNGILFVVGPRR